MLSMGASKPWPDAMEAITGQREMDATALRDYFQPLEDWLKRENQENQEIIGWKTGQCRREREGRELAGDRSSISQTQSRCTETKAWRAFNSLGASISVAI